MKIKKNYNLPYMPFYPKDFMMSEKVMAMSMKERGEYITLLCWDWNNDGIDPLLFNATTDSELVKSCFEKIGERMFNNRLNFEKKKIYKYCESQSEKGRLSGISRSTKGKNDEPRLNRGSVSVEPKLNQTNINLNIKSNTKEIKAFKDLKDSKNLLFDVVDLELAELLKSLILKNKHDRKIKGGIESWADEIRKMRTIDHRREELIREVIEWSQQDGFWWQNILSAKKLREKFDQLETKMKKDRPRINGDAAVIDPEPADDYQDLSELASKRIKELGWE